MDPSGPVQRRHGDDRHHKYHSRHHVDRDETQRRNEPVLTRREDGRGDDTQPKKKPEAKGPLAKYGTLLLAAGLGFAAGILYSEGTRRDRPKPKAAYRADGGRARSVGDRDDRRDRGRLEYRRSYDRLALMGPGVGGRSMSRSTYYAPMD